MSEFVVNKRVAIFIKKLGLNREQFARAIGVTPPAICDWLVNGKTLGKIVMSIIEAYPNLSAEWLLRGTGQMFIGDEHTTENRAAAASAPAIEPNTAPLPDPLTPAGFAYHSEVTRWQAIADERAENIATLSATVNDLTRRLAVAEYKAATAEDELRKARGYMVAEGE